MIHGVDSNKSDGYMLDLIKDIYEMGYSVFAFDLMDRLEINDTEQLKIINDAILRDPQMAQNPAGIGKISELYQTLKQKINQILTKDFDLGDI